MALTSPLSREIFLPILRSAIEGQVLRRHIAPVTLKTTDMGEEANAIGAAALVLHERLPHSAATTSNAARDAFLCPPKRTSHEGSPFNNSHPVAGSAQ